MENNLPWKLQPTRAVGKLWKNITCTENSNGRRIKCSLHISLLNSSQKASRYATRRQTNSADDSIAACKLQKKWNFPHSFVIQVLLYPVSHLEEHKIASCRGEICPLCGSIASVSSSSFPSLGSSLRQCGHSGEFLSHSLWQLQWANFLQHGKRRTLAAIILKLWCLLIKQNMQCWFAKALQNSDWSIYRWRMSFNLGFFIKDQE